MKKATRLRTGVLSQQHPEGGCVSVCRRGETRILRITRAMMQLMMMPAGQDHVKLNIMMVGDEEEV